MEAEQTQLFNQKLSQWIASQGFWFQLRHSMSGGGGWSMTVSHLMRLGAKVAMVLLVAACGFAIYLFQRVKTESFTDSLNAGLVRGLGAAEAKVLYFTRSQGGAQIRRVGVEGGASTFFRNLDAGNVRLKMGLLDGLAKSWDAGTLQAKWMELDLKAGADSAGQAKALGDSLFREWQGFNFSSVDVEEATLRWGFSARTQGLIEKSHMVATRGAESWRIVFKGGTFSQNWLKKLEIVELIAECGPGGMKVTRGDFKSGGGVVTFHDVAVAGGEKPAVTGNLEISKADLASFIPESARPYVEGVISGEFELSGSTNSVDGIRIEGDVTLGEGDGIVLREKIELLNVLSAVDLYNNYFKVPFDRGSFHLKTGGGSMELSRVDLRSGELMTLQGQLTMRYPREGESIGADGAGQFAPVFNPEGDASQVAKGPDLTLEKAAKAEEAEKKAKETKGKKGSGAGVDDMAIFERGAQRRIDELLLQQELARRAQALRCEPGSSLKVTIPGDAFNRSEVLRRDFPVDPATGRIAIVVPLEGTLHEMTRRQADEMRKTGLRN